MMRKIIYILLIVSFGSIAVRAQTDEPNPALIETYERQLNLFEETGNLATAYHAARFAMRLGREGEAVHLLSRLRNGGWKLGLDPADFSLESNNPALATEISRLQQALGSKRPHSRVVFQFDDPRLFPESIGLNPTSGVLFAGSLLKPRVSYRVAARETMPDQDMKLPELNWGVIYGIKFHPGRDELWVLHNRQTEEGMLGGLAVVNVDGDLQKTYRVAGAPALELNDLCFRENQVFVTDSTAGTIYRGDLNGELLSPYYQDPEIRYPNGIACADDTEDIYVAHASGLAAISSGVPQAHRSVAAPEGYSLGGIDGLYLWSGHLVGVQNYLGAPKVLVAHLSSADTADLIDLRDTLHPEYHIPTTGFIDGNCFYYIANSSLDLLPANGADATAQQPGRARVLGLSLSRTPGACSFN